MPGFDWRETMSVGVEEIDKQHKQLLGAISDLNDAIIKHEVEKVLNNTFDKLFKYIEFHFATEEKYFDDFNYSEAEAHKAAHKFFAKKVNEMHQTVDNDIHELSLELVAFLEFWLVGHVLVMDKRYTECFHKHGLK